MAYPIILLSPSKSMRDMQTARELHLKVSNQTGEGTLPGVDRGTTEYLFRELQKLSLEEIQEYFSLSPQLAQKVHGYYKMKSEVLPAWTLYTGEAFVFLDLPGLMMSNPKKAASSIVILSALYGALSPMDVIQPYRLDFTLQPLPNYSEVTGGLRTIWKPKVLEYVRNRIEEEKVDFILSCASSEYERLVTPLEFQVPFISVEFIQKHPKNGQPAKISARAKQARGMFARWVVLHHPSERLIPEKFEDFFSLFTLEGYGLQRCARVQGSHWSLVYSQV